MLDVLSQSLEQLRLRGARYRRLLLQGGWIAPFTADVRGIHIVERGQCELVADGYAPRLLEPFDYVILPHGGKHVLRAVGAQRGQRVPMPTAPSDTTLHFRARGQQGPVSIACGVFSFGTALEHPVLQALSPVLVVASRTPGSPVTAHVESLLLELSSPTDGSNVVVARLSDVLLVHAIREFTAAPSPAARGRASVFAGLRHPQIGAALRLMHESPEQPWTVQLLARSVGLSRASFAEHFRREVGESPLAYLTRFRISMARTLLRETREPLKVVAERTGYGSAASLSLAFKRTLGRAPGKFRAALP
jgi:AraC-like DNA-binding protein